MPQLIEATDWEISKLRVKKKSTVLVTNTVKEQQ